MSNGFDTPSNKKQGSWCVISSTIHSSDVVWYMASTWNVYLYPAAESMIIGVYFHLAEPNINKTHIFVWNLSRTLLSVTLSSVIFFVTPCWYYPSSLSDETDAILHVNSVSGVVSFVDNDMKYILAHCPKIDDWYIYIYIYIYIYMNYYAYSLNRNTDLLTLRSLSTPKHTASWLLTFVLILLQWRHNERNGVLNYRRLKFGAALRKHQSSASLAFVRGIRGWPVNSPHKGPVTQKCFHL